MHYAILACVHGNLEALQAVLADAASRGVEAVMCLGDVVGLGPDPVACVDLVREKASIVLKGCCDEAITGSMQHLAAPTRASIEWSKEALAEDGRGEERLAFLAGLPFRYDAAGVQFVHASPRDPTQEYLFAEDVQRDPRKLQRAFALVEKVIFVGHTHVAGVHRAEPLSFQPASTLEGHFHYKRGEKLIVNVGSVGQPKDGDPRACYLEVSKNEMHWRRVEYDVAKVVEKVKANARLSPALGARLLRGI